MSRIIIIIVFISLCAVAYGQEIVFPDSQGFECVPTAGESRECIGIADCPGASRDLQLGVINYCDPFQLSVCCLSQDDSGNGRGRKNRPRGNGRRRGNRRRNNRNRRRKVKAPKTQFDCGTRTKIQTGFLVRGRRSPADVNQIGVQVVGGVNSERNSWPWMALIGRKTGNTIDWFCDGALINEEWVLSAAHCIEGQENVFIRLGEHDYSRRDEGPTPQDFDILQSIIYKDYDPNQAYHDMALIKLSKRAQLTDSVRPVCLPWNDQTNSDFRRESVTLTGWGTTQFGGNRSPILQEVNITVFDPSVCERSYSPLGDFRRLWPDGMNRKNILCAGDREGGKDACQGDSGGPLVHHNNGKYTLAGVVSRGLGCGQAEFPGIYAPVAQDVYLRWIKQTAF